MATLFTRIINGEIPGRFVWRDDQCVAFLSIQPLRPGHVLVVPRREVDHWIDLEPQLAQHVFAVAQSLAKALQNGFDAIRDLDFAKQDPNPKPADLDQAAETIRTALRHLGFAQVADR
jgi:histidine triad (HIT) family protein